MIILYNIKLTTIAVFRSLDHFFYSYLNLWSIVSRGLNAAQRAINSAF